MKKLILYTTAVLLIMLSTTIQSKGQQTSKIGIKGGLNFSNLSGGDFKDTKLLPGFNLGLFAKLVVSEAISIQPEIYFTTKGAEVEINDNVAEGSAKFNFNYLELPLLLVLNVTPAFNLHAGPYIAYLISGRVSNNSNFTLLDYDESNAGDYRRVDAGLAIGAGIDVGAIGIGIRYNYGLTTVGKERTYAGTSYTYPDATNSVFNCYISLSLN